MPDDTTLRRWIREGNTQEQIIELVYAETGERVARSTVAAAIHRAGLVQRPQVRYEREIPWRVKPKHATAYPARMLRDLGRIRNGENLPTAERQRFDSWWNWIVEENLVVCYDPDSAAGFWYDDNRFRSDCPDGTPIRPGISTFTE